MSTESISPPYPSYFEEDGSPLENGYVYIGEEGQDAQAAPITVYWDFDLTQPVAQPIRTSGGYLARSGTPSRVYTNQLYSIKVLDSQERQVYSSNSDNNESVLNTTTTLVYDDLADMRAQPGAVLATNQTATLMGGSTIGDQVAKIYYWDPTSTATDDGDSVVKLTDTATGRFLYTSEEGTYINVLNYGVTNDGVDTTTALQALLDNSIVQDLNRALFFPAGNYRVSSTLTVPTGCRLLGETGAAEETTDGVYFNAAHSGAFIQWTGINPSDRSPGGGLENMRISGQSSTTCVSITPTFPAEFRSFVFKNLYIDDYDEVFDIVGQSGDTVYNVLIDNVKAEVGSTSCGSFSQVQDLKINFLRIRHSNPSVDTDLTIDNCQDVNIQGLDLEGGLLYTNNVSGSHLNASGRAVYFNNDSSSVDGNINLLLDTSPSFSVDNTSKQLNLAGCNRYDAFMAYRTVSDGNVTGNSTLYTLLANVEDYDLNDSYDSTTGVFTAKIAGLYQFSGQITWDGLTSAHTGGAVYIEHRNSGGTVLNQYRTICDPQAQALGGQLNMPVTAVWVNGVSEGDTFRLIGVVSNSSQTVDAYEDGTTGRYCWFGGRYLGSSLS